LLDILRHGHRAKNCVNNIDLTMASTANTYNKLIRI